MKIGYIRVSTVEQNLDRQLKLMEQYGVEKVFSEKISGKSMERPQLKELLDFAREGDVVYVADFSRLARNTQGLLNLVQYFSDHNITLISHKENIDTSTATGRLFLTITAAINTFERENLKERQLEGIAIAKEKGKYKGRKPIEVEEFEKHYAKWKNREITKTQLAKELGISRQTLYTLFNKYAQNIENSTQAATL